MKKKLFEECESNVLALTEVDVACLIQNAETKAQETPRNNVEYNQSYNSELAAQIEVYSAHHVGDTPLARAAVRDAVSNARFLDMVFTAINAEYDRLIEMGYRVDMPLTYSKGWFTDTLRNQWHDKFKGKFIGFSDELTTLDYLTLDSLAMLLDEREENRIAFEKMQKAYGISVVIGTGKHGYTMTISLR